MPGIDFSAHVTNPIAQGPAPAALQSPAAQKDDSSASGFGFDDLLDIVNPLQHIPVVSTIYRHLTGDKIGTPEKLAGDALYGGLTGFLCSLGDTLFQEITGKSVGDTVYAMVIGDDDKPTAVADNTTPASVTPASASSFNISLPGLSLLNEAAPDQAAVSPAITQQAIRAYRAAGRTIEAY